MAYQIIWSPVAAESFGSIIDYLEKHFTQKEIANFVRLVNRRLLVMKSFPKTGRKTTKTSKRRRTVLHKKTILYFSVNEKSKEVRLLLFFDTRQNSPKSKR